MLPRLQAEQQLLRIEAVSTPDMKPEARTALLRRYIDRISGRRKPTSAVEAFAAAGIRVVEVPTPTHKPRKPRGRSGTRRGGDT